jgi:putative FmdB family regulatory protein
MPTYDYLCDACGHKFELFQSINDPVQKKCPACKKLKLRRLFGTGAAIVFKGSGFYQTDYRSDSYKKAASADSKNGESKPAKEGEGKSGSGKGETSSSKSEPSTGKSEPSSGKSEGGSGDKSKKPKSTDK